MFCPNKCIDRLILRQRKERQIDHTFLQLFLHLQKGTFNEITNTQWHLEKEMHKSSLLGQIELAWLKQDKSYEFFPLTTRLSINEEIYYSLSNNNLQYGDHHLYYGVRSSTNLVLYFLQYLIYIVLWDLMRSSTNLVLYFLQYLIYIVILNTA